MLSSNHLKLLEARGLDAETVVRFGVRSSVKLGPDTISIPYFRDDEAVNFKHRTIAGDKKFCQEPGAPKLFWNWNVIADAGLANEPLIITEGEFDAMIAVQCGYARTVSVPDGAPAQELGDAETRKYAFLGTAPTMLADVKEIILATDGDAPGINLMNDLALRLGKGRCRWVKYPVGCKDLNEAFLKYGQRGVTETLRRAQWVAVPGLARMSELPPLTEPDAHDIGIIGLEKHYRMRLGDLCVVTGTPGSGKTTVINEMAARMALKGWPVVFASFEQQPQTDHRRALRTLHGGRRVVDLSSEQIAAADEWIDDKFMFIVPSEDDEPTLDWVMERIATAAVRHGARLAVIDPWNELEHQRDRNESETDYAGYALRRLRKFARKFNIHLIVAAHPAKMQRAKDGKYPMPSLYDIAGSAHFSNKPDVGLIVHRLDEVTTVLNVAKSRYASIGIKGEVFGSFNVETGRYQMIEDEKVAGLRYPQDEAA